MSAHRLPCAYFNHGGGPMPLLGQQPGVADALSSYSGTLDVTPRAILGKISFLANLVVLLL